MKKLMTILLTIFMFTVCAAQDEVTLTVTGSGATKEEAVNNALRSAVAQTYGVFVSANTQLLNDELIKDEIATVTSGNIKGYKEIGIIDLPTGVKEITIQATVSISKLISYAKSKGAEAEFAGATFAQNMKIRELNKSSESCAFRNILTAVISSLPLCYDKKLEIAEPRELVDDIAIPVSVKYTPNNNLKKIIDNFKQVLSNMSLKESDIKAFSKAQISYSVFTINAKFENTPHYEYTKAFRLGNDARYKVKIKPSSNVFILRKYYGRTIKEFENNLNDFFCTVKLKDNLGNVSTLKGYNKSYSSKWDGYVSDYPNTSGILSSYAYEEGWSACTPNLGIEETSGLFYSRSISYKGILPYWFADGKEIDLFWNTSKPFELKIIISIPKEEVNKYSHFELID